jgi:hypothetical protein
LASGSIAPVWVGLTVWVIWFLPLLLCVGVRWMLVCGVISMASLARLRASPQLLGLFACQLLELLTLIFTWSYLGAWLLYKADGTL